jgi:hypothetical protein
MLNDSKGLTVTMKRSSGYGDPDLYVTINGPNPSFATWDYQAIGCDSCEKPIPSAIDIPFAKVVTITFISYHTFIIGMMSNWYGMTHMMCS